MKGIKIIIGGQIFLMGGAVKFCEKR